MSNHSHSRCKFNRSTLLLLALLMAVAPRNANAQYIRYDQPTDTIRIPQNTNLSSSVTYECQIQFTSNLQGTGFVFNEWTFAAEDKWFRVGTDHISGFSFPTGGPGHFATNPTLTLNSWHHVAYVHDGNNDNIYLDGSLVGTRTATGSIANSSGLPQLGAYFRDNIIFPGIVGYLDSFRMSSIARYTGSSFTPPIGDLPADANTIMLFNFNEAAGSTVLNDLSGNGFNGELGIGFGGATSPEFVSAVPEPSTYLLIISVITFTYLAHRYKYAKRIHHQLQ